MWTKFRAFLLVCWQDTQLRQLPNISNMSSNSPRIFLYRFLEAEYPNHDNQLNNGWKAATDGEYPPGEIFKHDLWFVGFGRFTSTVHSPTGPGLGRPWPLWQYRAALWKLCCPKFLLQQIVLPQIILSPVILPPIILPPMLSRACPGENILSPDRKPT